MQALTPQRQPSEARAAAEHVYTHTYIHGVCLECVLSRPCHIPKPPPLKWTPHRQASRAGSGSCPCAHTTTQSLCPSRREATSFPPQPTMLGALTAPRRAHGVPQRHISDAQHAEHDGAQDARVLAHAAVVVEAHHAQHVVPIVALLAALVRLAVDLRAGRYEEHASPAVPAARAVQQVHATRATGWAVCVVPRLTRARARSLAQAWCTSMVNSLTARPVNSFLASAMNA